MEHRLRNADAPKKSDLCATYFAAKNYQEAELMIYKFYKRILVEFHFFFGIDLFPKSRNPYNCFKIFIFTLNGILILATVIIVFKSITSFNTIYFMFHKYIRNLI